MSTSMQSLIDACLLALGDTGAAIWGRTTHILPWCNQAMLDFPILKPMQMSFFTIGETHTVTLTGDFRQIISVEYPVNQEPPRYLSRKNRFDPTFFESAEYYDIDRGFSVASGWQLWTSKNLPIGASIKINYLANHKTDCTDAADSLISVADEHVPIIVAMVVARAYRERLSKYMQSDPTLYTDLVKQLTDMVDQAEKKYKEMTEVAIANLTYGKITKHLPVDKYDRVY